MVNECHVCSARIKAPKNGELPVVCPSCGTDLENPNAETIRYSISCEHLKGALGINEGDMVITNQRLLWIARAPEIPEDDEIRRNTLVDGILARKAGTIPVNVPLDNLSRIEDCKKLLRKVITVHTKTGESYNFFLQNRGNPQILKDFLAPYVANS